jgi:lipopolysaccharide export system protein LptA
VRNKFIILFVFILCFSSQAICLAEKSVAKDPSVADMNQPIQITSDKLEAFSEKRMVIFSGNALAVQGGRIIKADSLLLYYKQVAGEVGKGESTEVAKSGELEKMEAKGHVKITQGERVITGDNATYFSDTQKVIMTGNAVMREGKNVIRGEKIAVFLNENRGYVESNESKRVSATIYPAGKKDK